MLMAAYLWTVSRVFFVNNDSLIIAAVSTLTANNTATWCHGETEQTRLSADATILCANRVFLILPALVEYAHSQPGSG